MSSQFTERNHLVMGLAPVADAFAGDVYSDVVKMTNFEHATFVIMKGVGATGTADIIVEAVDDAAGNNPVAIPFRYREILSGDTPGDLTYAEATGFTTTAGSAQMYAVEVDAEKLAASGKNWLRLKSAEDTDSPVVGAILAILSDPKFAAPFETAIA